MHAGYIVQRTSCSAMPFVHSFFCASAPSRRRQAKVAAAIADKDVGVLVNNVGVSYNFPKYFDELTDEEVKTHDKLV